MRKTLKNKKLIPVTFSVDLNELELLEKLRLFFRLRKRSKLIHYLILFAALDVAHLKRQKIWTEYQIQSWKYCKRIAKDFLQLISLEFAKEFLVSQDLSQLTKEELLKLAKAENLTGLTGLHKPGLIKKLKEAYKYD